MKSAVFFNLDDTLTNRTKEYPEMYSYAVKESDLEQLEDGYQEYTDSFFKYFKQNYVFPRRQAIQDLMKDRDLFEPGKQDEFAEAWEEAESDYLELKDGVEEVLEKLSDDYKLGIATNGTGKLQRKKIEKLGIDKYFDTIVISSEVGASKPDPIFFKRAKEELEAERYFIVSHMPKRDILGGLNSGMKPIWVADTDSEIDDDSVVRITDLKHLPDTLERI